MPNEFIRELRVLVNREFWSRHYDVSAMFIDGPASPEGVRRRCAKVEWVDIDEGVTPPNIFSLDEANAQTLMDNLWQLGLRPTEGAGSAGAMAATQRHLEDMRTLVFNRSEQRDLNEVG